MKRGSSVVSWHDFGDFAYIETDSELLAHTLMEAGLKPMDTTGGVLVFRVPVAWLRLRTPGGLLRLGRYKRRGGKLVPAFERTPKLRLITTNRKHRSRGECG